jgi:hypothetical protein
MPDEELGDVHDFFVQTLSLFELALFFGIVMTLSERSGAAGFQDGRRLAL